MYRIIEKKELAPDIKLFRIFAPDIARKVKPGHFVILKVNETGERIPLTVNDFNRERGTVTMVFQEVGKTTKLLGTLEVGDGILDLMGPCGKPSKIEKFGRVICVGGGVGMAVIYPIVRALAKAGNKVIGIIGAKTKELIIFEKEMDKVCHKLYIATDDGSKGFNGFVTELLKSLLEKEGRIDRLITIGPVLMMKFVSEITQKANPLIKTIVSLNSIMIDGTGMCGGCRVEVGGKTLFTCVDGPEFDGHQVNWGLLLSRLNQYKKEEKLSLERWSHDKTSCKNL